MAHDESAPGWRSLLADLADLADLAELAELVDQADSGTNVGKADIIQALQSALAALQTVKYGNKDRGLRRGSPFTD